MRVLVYIPCHSDFDFAVMQARKVKSDFDYFKELFSEIKCGINVNPNSPKDIAKAIDDLIDNPIKRKKMAENGYKAIINKLWNDLSIK